MPTATQPRPADHDEPEARGTMCRLWGPPSDQRFEPDLRYSDQPSAVIVYPVGWSLQSRLCGVMLVNMFGQELYASDVFAAARAGKNGFALAGGGEGPT